MKKISLILFAVAAILQSCAKKETTAEDNNEFKKVLDNYYKERMKLFPIESTTSGDSIYNNLLPNNLTDEYNNEVKAFFEKYVMEAKKYADNDLSENDRLSKELLLWECDMNIEQLGFKEYLIPMNQFTSLPLTIGQFASGSSAQPFKTYKDYTNWLERLEKFNKWLATAQLRMKEGVSKGYVLPRSLTVKMIPQLKDLANEDTQNHLFYSPVKAFPTSFTDAKKKELTDKYTAILKQKLIPSFNKLYNYVSNDYLKASRSTSGISAIPNGKKYYDHLIKRYTTTDMTAEEIHQLGLKEVARLTAEMEKVKTQVGFTGPLKDFFNYVRNKKELMPFTEPQQVIDNFNAIHERMKPNLEKLFDLKPKTPFEVRRTEAFREASASAEYNQGSLDGTRPGIFYVPIPDVKKYNVYADEDLFLHEAIPGHHYQISIQQENTTLPDFRKTIWFNAYGEGWALYTESLGKELGLYSDPYQYFGMLSAEMHRALRLVIDTGLHTKDWTREQAIKYSMENEAEPEESIIAEVERYMAIPGQALSYKIGQLKIRELRTKAEKELGTKFSIKEFHNQVLDAGCLPLKVLEGKINKWIESKK
ncbi:DUF885 domain-containing protein [Flavobacterium sp. AG291]|uniref:DUF885 domain-containing protein n=1 Tax=Flavobacterium sp. AG291 TaxID=2184000 RepID=UPI000E0A23AF|nr:DUF885 domain-containing protein [Flavobacterium sp. AG291]RDI15829.1 uncharacterized protein (DUF885 family) [Flavobacterium sp. AG291]